MNFKPQLYSNNKEALDLESLNYPLYASYKLDGIRCIFKDGEMLSRSLKPIRNKNLQLKFEHYKAFSKEFNTILDGELYCHGMSFQGITSAVMSSDKIENCDKIKFMCFDYVLEEDYSMPYETRYRYLHEFVATSVKQTLVHSAEEVMFMFREAVKYKGYEGLILRNPSAGYKCGRVTLKSGDGYKLKPYETFDARVLDIEERMNNSSEGYINELGHHVKHKFKDKKVPTGIAGAFVVEFYDKELRVMIPGDLEFRKELFKHKLKYLGKFIEFKAMKVGMKDLPRHPVFIRWRDDK